MNGYGILAILCGLLGFFCAHFTGDPRFPIWPEALAILGAILFVIFGVASLATFLLDNPRGQL